MILAEHKIGKEFIYLCGPRTGSRSTSDALRKHCGGRSLINGHHANKEQVEKWLRKYDCPVYTTIRDPYDYLLSAFKREGRKYGGFEQFIQHWDPDQLGKPSGFGPSLFPYRNYANHCFIFELGLDEILSRMGFPDVTPCTLGTDETPAYRPIERCPPEYKAKIDEKYADDISLYNHWKSRQHLVGHGKIAA